MASFQYEALRISDRTRISGLINAGSEKEARELLREQELVPTKLQVISGSQPQQRKASKTASFILGLFQGLMGVSAKDKITFTQNMAMMIRAGIPIAEGLLYYENYCKNPKFKRIVSQIRRDILAGYAFSQALAKHKKIFNDSFVTITQAGERSGELEETMNRLTHLLEKSDKLKAKVISAAVYPCIVMGITVIVVLIMFLLVIPTFAEIYKKLGVPLPMLTQVVMGISSFLKDGWYISFPILGAVIFGLFKYCSSPTGRALLDRIVLKIPVFGTLVIFVNNSYLLSTLHVSFGAGLPIIEALYLSIQTVGNSVMREGFQDVNLQIQTGQKLAIALAKTGFVPDIVLLLLSIGEESGDLEKMLENAFEYLESEVNKTVDILTSLMEPMLLLVLGSIVSVLALSIYLPLYEMYKHL